MDSTVIDTYKAIQLLSVFNDAEHQSLKEYVSIKSKAYRPQVIEVLNQLQEHKAKLPISKNEVERLTSLSNKRLSDIMNKMLVLLEEFCMIHSMFMNSDAFEKKRHLLLFLSNKKLSSQYDFHYDKNLSSIYKADPICPWEHLCRYRYIKSVSVHEKIEKGRKLSIKLSDYVLHLDVFYCIERLKLYCENISRAVIKGKREIPEEFDLIILMSEKYRMRFPIVATYIRIAKTLSGEEPSNAKNFNAIYQWVIELQDKPAAYEEVLTVCHYLINIALMGIKANDKQMKQCLIELISFMDQNSLLLERGTISAPIFKVAISVAVKNNQMSWAEKFFAKYSTYLSERNKDAITKYCSAIIVFAKKDFTNANLLISKIRYSDVDIYFILNLKVLDIQLFIEEHYKRYSFSDITYYGIFYDKARAFRLFVLSHEDLGSSKKKGALNFIKYLRKIIKRSQSAYERKSILQQLEKSDSIAENEWLQSLLNR